MSVSAQSQNPVFGLLGTARGVVGQAVPLLMGVAMVVFFYGLVMFIWKGKEGGETLEKSKSFMIYSLISFFVMASIWGIVGFLQNTTGIDPNAQVKVPPIPGMNQ
jgi:hypothetical protein